MLAATDGSDDGYSGTSRSRNSGELRRVSGADRVVLALDDLWNLLGSDAAITAENEKTRETIVRVTTEARIAGLRPEELLTLLKSSWRTRSQGRRGGRDEAEEDQLTRLVTLCIKSYFTDGKPG